MSAEVLDGEPVWPESTGAGSKGEQWSSSADVPQRGGVGRASSKRRIRPSIGELGRGARRIILRQNGSQERISCVNVLILVFVLCLVVASILYIVSDVQNFKSLQKNPGTDVTVTQFDRFEDDMLPTVVFLPPQGDEALFGLYSCEVIDVGSHMKRDCEHKVRKVPVRATGISANISYVINVPDTEASLNQGQGAVNSNTADCDNENGRRRRRRTSSPFSADNEHRRESAQSTANGAEHDEPSLTLAARGLLSHLFGNGEQGDDTQPMETPETREPRSAPIFKGSSKPGSVQPSLLGPYEPGEVLELTFVIPRPAPLMPPTGNLNSTRHVKLSTAQALTMLATVPPSIDQRRCLFGQHNEHLVEQLTLSGDVIRAGPSSVVPITMELRKYDKDFSIDLELIGTGIISQIDLSQNVTKVQEALDTTDPVDTSQLTTVTVSMAWRGDGRVVSYQSLSKPDFFHLIVVIAVVLIGISHLYQYVALLRGRMRASRRSNRAQTRYARSDELSERLLDNDVEEMIIEEEADELEQHASGGDDAGVIALNEFRA